MVSAIEKVSAMGNPRGNDSIPLMRFIPKKLATNVGNINSIDTTVSVFMTVDMLLLMMLA